MKINEVEALVGITRKNIRFYEEQRLLSPRRNSANGYRDYGEAEVEALKRIKLMRKLGLPMEEIRQMQRGERTVGDAMRRHRVTLERQMENARQSLSLCAALEHREIRLDDLDAGEVLSQMEDMERSGASFEDRQREDVRIRYAAPLAVSVTVIGFMGFLMALIAWAIAVDPAEALPWPLTVVLLAMPALVILGVVLALVQRFKEIQKGEIDDARQY